MKLFSLLVTAALVLACGSVAADPEGCRDAVDAYSSASSEVLSAVRTYANCVASSRGRDDCSIEFSTLNSAHDDFESAVSEYESECSP
jgi:hypothetical protein